MTLPELLMHKMQASSGNEATFDVAFISPEPGAPASRITVVSRWKFTPTRADIEESRALICTLSNFTYAGSTDNIRAAMNFQATGNVADPGMN